MLRFHPSFLTGSLFLIFCCASCKRGGQNADPELFDKVPTEQKLLPVINEVSGIADSKINVGYLWTQEDGGNPPRLMLVHHDGTVSKSIYLKGVTNRDWEDIALVGNEIYIAETGDNGQAYADYAFYRINEPAIATDTVDHVQAIRFVYPDGSHDAEAFLVDPVTKDIFIITKRDLPSRVYKLSYPYQQNNTLSFIENLSFTGVTSAALSVDGKEILVKNYNTVYYYHHQSTEPVSQSLLSPYKLIPVKSEPQGEALCFAQDGSGFYTLSEKASAPEVQLYFYHRK
jgi:hypothetical protein